MIYGEEGLNEPAKAVAGAADSWSQHGPTAPSYYAQLAEFAYKAKNERLGDLAAAKAVSLAPANERTRVKNELEEVKKFPNGGQTFTTTTNGKVYTVKKARTALHALEAPTPAPRAPPRHDDDSTH